jgi:hypothetical protein
MPRSPINQDRNPIEVYFASVPQIPESQQVGSGFLNQPVIPNGMVGVGMGIGDKGQGQFMAFNKFQYIGNGSAINCNS